MSLLESLTIIKHNRWVLMWLMIDFFRMLAPQTDRMFFYQFLLEKKTLFRREFNGMALKTLLDLTLEWPGFVLTPLAPVAVKKLGGPVNFIRTHTAVLAGTQLLSFFVGYKTWPRLITFKLLETLRDTMTNWRPVADNVIQYEMFDYVEWKTGYRSEGITQSLRGLSEKFIKDSVNSIVGNAITDWTGFKSWETPAAQQPKRFINSLWPLLHFGPMLSEFIAFIAVLWFKYPHDPKEVEADLIARRALAAKMMDELQAADKA